MSAVRGGRIGPGANMATITYERESTALLVIGPYNDFISEGGKTVECKGGGPSRRGPDPQHELLRQRDRRQAPGAVIAMWLRAHNRLVGGSSLLGPSS